MGTSVYQTPTVDDADEVNAIICNIEQSADADMSTDTGYTKYGTTSMDTAVGVAISGVVMLNGVSIDEVDPMYPAVYGTVTDTEAAKETFDMCLAHPQMSGAYHYHAFSPCAVDASYATTPQSCDDITACTDDVLSYGEDAYASLKTLTPIGLAKDGHIIYGIYKADGTIVSDCDVDVCNGAWINGVYGYYATPFHPYYVGCWGPGNNVTVSQECSTNPRTCSDGDSASFM